MDRRKKADNDLMQDAEKSEGCISTRACMRKEWEVQTRLCLRRHPRTKIVPFRERGADGKYGNKDLGPFY